VLEYLSGRRNAHVTSQQYFLNEFELLVGERAPPVARAHSIKDSPTRSESPGEGIIDREEVGTSGGLLDQDGG
jgi:hypothetical protein